MELFTNHRRIKLIINLLLLFLTTSLFSQNVGKGLSYLAEGERVFNEYSIMVNETDGKVLVNEESQQYEYKILLKTKGKGSRYRHRVFYAVTLDQDIYVIMLKIDEEEHHVTVSDTEGIVMREYGSWGGVY